MEPSFKLQSSALQDRVPGFQLAASPLPASSHRLLRQSETPPGSGVQRPPRHRFRNPSPPKQPLPLRQRPSNHSQVSRLFQISIKIRVLIFEIALGLLMHAYC
ncbi:hypothetical protein U1Q18_007491 [Sarracenia purpurea var. burkii]